MNKLSTKKLTYTGLFIALVFIFSAFFQIPLKTPMGDTRFHLGNAFCLLGGIILGPGLGGLAAGVGSAIFDLTNPLYFASAPFTFINKFMMGFVAGLIFHKTKIKNEKAKAALAGFFGQITYIILYLLYTFIKNKVAMGLSFEANMVEVVQKLGVSSINGVISVIVAAIFSISVAKRVKMD